MTICIASICNIDTNPLILSPAIVFCADRLLSSSINFEHGNPKIKLIPNRCIIMEAGDGTTSDLVLNKDILNSPANDKLSHSDVKDIAERINDNLMKLKQKKIEEKILSDFGLNLCSFLNKSKEFNESLLNDILSKIEDVKEEIELDFIIAGIDKDGTPQLYRVSSDEGLQCYNSIGFVAIGVGTPLSLLELTKSTHTNYLNINESLFKVYSAKKGAEKVAGVGKKTDFGVLYLEGADKDDKNWRMGLAEILEPEQKIFDTHIGKINQFESKIREEIKQKLEGLIFKSKKPAKKEEKSEEKVNEQAKPVVEKK